MQDSFPTSTYRIERTSADGKTVTTEGGTYSFDHARAICAGLQCDAFRFGPNDTALASPTFAVVANVPAPVIDAFASTRKVRV